MLQRRYIGYTTAVCEECLKLVPTKIIEEDGSIFFWKQCPAHGIQKTRISTDIEYYMQCQHPYNQNYSYTHGQSEVYSNCPYDCGLCSSHEHKTCMAMVELTDDCNIKCATCIAGSCPGGQTYITQNEMNKILDTLYAKQKSIDLLMLSGGEPTIHPQIIDYIDLCKSRKVKHLMLITNGVRIANDEGFVAELAKRKQHLEIYLQFDSLRSKSLLDIRGLDLSDIRKKSVEMLEKYEIHSTLVCIVKKGTNENELKEILDFARAHKYIRGVTLQPLKDIGRGNEFNKETNYLTLTEVRDLISKTGFIDKQDLMPHPCNTACISIGYVNKDNKPITHYLYNSFVNKEKLKDLMYFLPELNTAEFKYEDLFRVTIVSFLDKYNFNLRDVKKSCIHFISPDGRIVPFDTHYIYH